MECEILRARALSGQRKAQVELMEYILLVVFIAASIIGIILFLSWWNAKQLQVEGFKNQEDRLLAIGQYIMSDYSFVNGESMLDDSKLTSINAIHACQDLEGIFGSGWYARIKSLDMEGSKECDWMNYPECNSWAICDYTKVHISQKFPVNVYRKVQDKVALGILEVGVVTS